MAKIGDGDLPDRFSYSSRVMRRSKIFREADLARDVAEPGRAPFALGPAQTFNDLFRASSQSG